jgi:hypothetical protein
MNGNTTPTSSAAATMMPGQQQQHKVFVLESSENNSHLGRVQRFKIQAREVCHSMVCCLGKSSSSSSKAGGGGEEAVVGKVKEFRLDPNQGYNTWLYWLLQGRLQQW